jgi:hypothetical protein
MNANHEIERRVQSFVAELSVLVRKQALAAVQEALGGNSGSAVRERPAPPRQAVAKATNGKGTGQRLPRLRNGQRRDPRDLARLVAAVRSHIGSHPGEGAETIAKQLGITTKELALPIQKLLADKAIRKTGQKRATRYFGRG